MKQLSYIKLNKAETRDLLGQLNPLFDGADMSDQSADIISAALSFYPGYRLLEISDRSSQPVRKRFVIYKTDNQIIIDYTNGPIYALNGNCPIHLSQDNLTQYIEFFFNFVHGKHGKFHVIESVDEIKWREEPTPNARRALSDMIQPMNIEKVEDDGSYVVMANIIFKNALFQCSVTVQHNGMVRLSQEKLLVQDLPVIDNVINV